MLTIRKEQMLALSASMVRSFEERMVAHLAANFPQQFEQLKEAGVQKLVRMGIDKGALYGVNSVRDVTTLVELMIEFGADFELQPGRTPVKGILQHPSRSAQARMELVYLRLKGSKRNS
jgi:hypothetical protein